MRTDRLPRQAWDKQRRKTQPLKQTVACFRSEVFDHFKDKLDKKVIIHIWKSVTNVTEPLADGYNAIVNVGYDALSWYLDNLGTDWEHVYMNEPCTGVPDYLCPMVLGGHGEMW